MRLSVINNKNNCQGSEGVFSRGSHAEGISGQTTVQVGCVLLMLDVCRASLHAFLCSFSSFSRVVLVSPCNVNTFAVFAWYFIDFSSCLLWAASRTLRNSVECPLTYRLSSLQVVGTLSQFSCSVLGLMKVAGAWGLAGWFVRSWQVMV